MNKLLKVIFILAVLLIIISMIGLFNGENLYSQIGFYVGLSACLIVFSTVHLLKANSSKLFGIYLLIFTGLFVCMNYEPFGGLSSMVYVGFENLELTLQNLFYLCNTCFAIFCLIINDTFTDLRKRKVFYLVVILMAFYLILEMPIYDIHGDLGGRSHGHSYWHGFHFH